METGIYTKVIMTMLFVIEKDGKQPKTIVGLKNLLCLKRKKCAMSNISSSIAMYEKECAEQYLTDLT